MRLVEAGKVLIIIIFNIVITVIIIIVIVIITVIIIIAIIRINVLKCVWLRAEKVLNHLKLDPSLSIPSSGSTRYCILAHVDFSLFKHEIFQNIKLFLLSASGTKCKIWMPLV